MQIYAYGSFGEAIYEELRNRGRDMRPKISIDLNTSMKSLLNADEHIHIFISDYPLFEKAKEMEDNVFRTNGVFIPIIMDYPYLSIGPVTERGIEGCFHCYIDRLLQHDRNGGLQIKTSKYYEESSLESHKLGFYPSDVFLVSQLLQNMLSTNSFDNYMGKLRRLNLYNRTSYYSKIVGVHGCERCGIQQGKKDQSFHELWRLFGEKELIENENG